MSKSGQSTGCLTPMIYITETVRQMLLSCKELLREVALFCSFRMAPKAIGHHTPRPDEISSVHLAFGKMQ